MLTLTLYYSLLLGLAGIFFIGCLSCYCTNRQIRNTNKAGLGESVKRFRLYKMLQYLGADFDTYIAKLPQQEISTHIFRCNSCPNLVECDNCLRDGHPPKSLNFCPNYKRLNELSRELAPESKNSICHLLY